MRAFEEFDRPFPRLGEVMERLGLDPVLALQCEAAALAQAIYRCQACDSEAACVTWLAGAGARVEASPEFCPNSALFACLRGAQPPADIGAWW